jgi:hypothetical protein
VRWLGSSSPSGAKRATANSTTRTQGYGLGRRVSERRVVQPEVLDGSQAGSGRDDCSECQWLLMTGWAERGVCTGEFLRGYDLKQVDLTGNRLAVFPPGVLPDGIQVRGRVRLRDVCT